MLNTLRSSLRSANRRDPSPLLSALALLSLTSACQPALAQSLHLARNQPANSTDEPAPHSTPRFGLHALTSYKPNDPNRPTVCLVHGLNSSAEVFLHWIKPLEDAGYGIVVYDYPYNRDLAITSREFERDWSLFRASWNDPRPWVLIAHSMGSLLARAYVEGPRFQRDVLGLILVAPPNHGSAIARAQALVELLKLLQSPRPARDFLQSLDSDVLGDAGRDLSPGSLFLKNLNHRHRPANIPYTIIAGDTGLLESRQRAQLEARLALLDRLTRRAGLPSTNWSAILDVLTDGIGDGCVTVESTRLEGVADHSTLHANHLELIRAPLMFPDPGPIAAWPLVLDRLQKLAPANGKSPPQPHPDPSP